MTSSSRYDQGAKISWQTLIGNVILTIVKAIAGVASGSAALVADAIHSGSDVLSTVVVLYGLKIAQRPPDEKHPYGHGRAEAVAAKVLSLMLIFVGLEMMVSAGKSIFSGTTTVPGAIALWAAVLSILTKEIMYRYTVAVGKRINSQALIADAWHHRSDAFSSVASFAGILLARSGYPVLDPVVAVVVALFVIRVGWNIFSSAVDEMMDAQVDGSIIDSVAEAANELDAVLGVGELRVHRYGAELHVDLKVKASSDLTLIQGHELAHEVEKSITKALPNASHIDVHVEPQLVAKDEA